jgi:ATP sulfurylase
MGKAHHECVFHVMRLANGTLFPMLITLFVSDPRGVKVGNCAVPRNDVLAVMLTEEIFLWSL